MIEGFHRAALSISCLRRKDRDWILRNLPSAERDKLNALLSELKETGIEPDISLVDEALSAVHEHQLEKKDVSQQVAEFLDVITLSTLGNVKDVLVKEPEWLVAIVLSASPWRWRKEFLNDMDSGERTHLASFQPQLREIKPQAVRMLLMVFAEELRTKSPVRTEWIDEIHIPSNVGKNSVKENPIWSVLSKWLS